jgi:methionine-rich copper-binding protein CopC
MNVIDQLLNFGRAASKRKRHFPLRVVFNESRERPFQEVKLIGQKLDRQRTTKLISRAASELFWMETMESEETAKLQDRGYQMKWRN